MASENESGKDALGTSYYLIFDDPAEAVVEPLEVSSDEIDEIEQIRRIVIEVTEEKPLFLVST